MGLGSDHCLGQGQIGLARCNLIPERNRIGVGARDIKSNDPLWIQGIGDIKYLDAITGEPIDWELIFPRVTEAEFQLILSRGIKTTPVTHLKPVTQDPIPLRPGIQKGLHRYDVLTFNQMRLGEFDLAHILPLTIPEGIIN